MHKTNGKNLLPQHPHTFHSMSVKHSFHEILQQFWSDFPSCVVFESYSLIPVYN